jgi:3-oxoadipate enol-lactonase
MRARERADSRIRLPSRRKRQAVSAENRRIALPTGVELHVRTIDFTDPWKPADTLLMLHGTAENGEAYRQWIPALARDFRIVCPDLRGAGQSTSIAVGAELEMDDLVRDTQALMEALGVGRYYVIGEKVGALLALRLAARDPDAVAGLAVACGMIAPGEVLGPWIPEWIRLIEQSGPRAWVDATQAGRMGDELAPAALAWWSELMASSDHTSLIAYLRMLQCFALSHDELRAVRAPTLFLVPSGGGTTAATFEQRRPRSELFAWQQLVPRQEVATIEGASYHLAATRPDACGAAARDFLVRIARESTQWRNVP